LALLAVTSIALFQLQLAIGTTANAASNGACGGAFGGSPSGTLAMTASVPDGGSISAGQKIDLTITWNTGDWSGLDQFADCFEINGTLDPSMTYEEKPPVNDGIIQHSVSVPGSLANGDTVCARARLSGQPIGGVSTQKSNTLCWTVGGTPHDPDVKVTKAASKTTVNSGDSLTFTLEASNIGDATATNVKIEDTIPAGFTITGAPGCTVSGQKVTCNVGDLDAGKSASVTIDVKATDAACPKIDNQATVSASNEPAGNTGNNTSNTVTVNVACPNPDVKITKSASSTSVSSGDTVTFTLEVSNVGSGTATSVVISDTIPSGLTITGAPGCTVSGQSVTCNVGDIVGGGKKSVTVTVKATDGACPSVDNKATVSASNEPSGNTGNNTSNTVTLNVTCPNPDVKIAKSSDASVTGVKPGDSFTYTIKVTNVGGSTATGVKVSDTIPSSLNITGTSATCSVGGQTVTCDLGDIASGASKSVTVTVKATDGSCPVVVNRATVTASNEPSGATGNNTSNDVSTSVNCDVPVEPGLSIKIVKTNDANGDGDYSDDEEAPRPDKDVKFLLVITNTGDADAKITDLTDAFDGETIDLLDGKCAELKGVTLASGDSVTCTFTLNSYSPPHGSPLTNTAEVCVENMDASRTDCHHDPSTVRSAEVLGATITPTKTPPGGVAFTGSNDTLRFGMIAFALMLLGSGLVWTGYRRRARYEG
jgi:uncharacterized repeat protein (TIGR01451 family)